MSKSENSIAYALSRELHDRAAFPIKEWLRTSGEINEQFGDRMAVSHARTALVNLKAGKKHIKGRYYLAASREFAKALEHISYANGRNEAMSAGKK